MLLRSGMLVVSFALGQVLGLGACDTAGLAPTTVEVVVLGDGDGTGRVTSQLILDRNEPEQIDCLLVANQPEGSCSIDFADAGLGGVVVLTATRNPGSTFVGWAGCTAVRANECRLAFEAAPREIDFTAIVTFELDPNNACNIAFGSNPGYVLCEETPISCTFYTLLNDVDSCTTSCESAGATCLRSLRDTDDTCIPGEPGACDEIVGDRLCECTKP